MNRMAKRAIVLAIMLAALIVLPAAAMAADLEIGTLAQLKAFRDEVCKGTDYSGTTVVLTADIDLGNEEWTPIGGNSLGKDSKGNTIYAIFKGHFDGKNHTISNLKITKPSTSNIGFFGYTANGSVQNLTIKNADIEGRLNVGVVAGTPYTSDYTNIKVTGKVTVDGMSYVGGVFGKNLYADADQITVDVSEGSYVRADSYESSTAYRTYVGGVVGFMGEGNHTVSNVKSNIDVIGTVKDIGGITGIAHYGNSFVNVTCSGDVSIEPANGVDAEDASEMGGIAGVWHNGGSAVTFENCKYTGTLTQMDGTKQYNSGLVGSAYSKSGTGTATLNGETVKDTYEIVVIPTPTPKPTATPAPDTSNMPQTGDHSNLALFALLLTASAAGMMLLMRRKGAQE